MDLSDCPPHKTVDHQLALAARSVAQGRVKAGALGGYSGGVRFTDPRALLGWLEAHRPPVSQPVPSHGDFSLPNLFLSEQAVTGFVDLGGMGTGDRWFDIAVCWRGLWENYRGQYRRPGCPEYDENALFRALHPSPDWERIRYDLLLEALQ